MRLHALQAVSLFRGYRLSSESKAEASIRLKSEGLLPEGDPKFQVLRLHPGSLTAAKQRVSDGAAKGLTTDSIIAPILERRSLCGLQASNLGGGVFRPLQALSAFNGAPSNDTWTLRIFDDAGADTGNLVSWSLQLSGAPEGAVPEPATWAMMLMGFGLIGAAMRRREKASVRFAF